ncbi:uncharacterized protein LOC126911683 [Spodoptera frugiperda]|uniref:Uncharacterized protein LOC126911683 n=2 Tax=Spodoptera frugiperda TaxID=7108 RepID=A0A9R0EZL7_SPOFR|nr:uncharacterized protein LOC126911683 [Spodoptera frugiperda]
MSTTSSVNVYFIMFIIIKAILLLLMLSPLLIDSHLLPDKTQLSELKKMCEHAYTCFHDLVIVCGKSVNEARTFLDICDLYEYSCEYHMVFRHVKEEEGVCPDPRTIPFGMG